MERPYKKAGIICTLGGLALLLTGCSSKFLSGGAYDSKTGRKISPGETCIYFWKCENSLCSEGKSLNSSPEYHYPRVELPIPEKIGGKVF